MAARRAIGEVAGKAGFAPKTLRTPRWQPPRYRSGAFVNAV
jgi:hypothetical protein